MLLGRRRMGGRHRRALSLLWLLAGLHVRHGVTGECGMMLLLFLGHGLVVGDVAGVHEGGGEVTLRCPRPSRFLTPDSCGSQALSV
jgi:hypothetical protein